MSLPTDLPINPISTQSDTPLAGPTVPDSSVPDEGKKKKKKKKEKEKTSRGVETMYRTTLANHLRLSELADQKANLMITINTLLISITMTSFLKPVGGMENLFIPEIMLLVVSLVTVVISLFATKPNVSSSAPRRTVGNRPLDLLFFGDYTQLSAEEYREAVRDLTADEKRLYDSLSSNIYAQGKVLHKKYRLLTIAYTFFMVGFSVVVISSLIVLITQR
jgi:hypothetical protein